jgi:hypothetical protein
MRLALGIVLAVALTATTARASEPAVMTLREQAHEARVSRSEIVWQSLYFGDGSVVERGQALRLDLAHPIVATLDPNESPGVTAVTRNGAIVALTVDPAHAPHWGDGIAVTLHASRAPGEILDAPLARGQATARIVVLGDDELRFEPTEPRIERHVGYWADARSQEPERRTCDEVVGARAPLRLDEIPIYVTEIDATTGIRGHFTTRKDRARPGVFAAACLFVLIVLGLGVTHLRLAGRARIEQAEAILREEYGESWRETES